MDFNGMVRHYYQRQAPYYADLRVTLLDKTRRQQQSHAIVLRLRQALKPFNREGVVLKVVEVPPGPPVLSTLVAEISGDEFTSYQALRDAAAVLQKRLQQEAHVVEVDSTVESDQYRQRFVVDREKAALSGISTDDINRTLALVNHGYAAGYYQLENEARPLPIVLKLDLSERASRSDLQRLQIRGLPGIARQSSRDGLDAAPQPMVALGELGTFEEKTADKAIYHKDLRPLVYVTAELSGRTPAEVIADVAADRGTENKARPWQQRNYLFPGGGISWQLDQGIDITWSGEGEWKITVDVFRDMGIAFLFALAGIFIVLRLQSGSSSLALIIMAAIPLTVIGILPGFWLLNLFGQREVAGAPDPVLFTATAMIGMIALAGIVVRNSLILVEFITQHINEGSDIRQALKAAGMVRMRPVLLTAGTTLLGNLVITLDPVFNGLALAIIFGIIASTLFTLLVVPVTYFLVFNPQQLGEVSANG
jgi:multidrug efflux pump subunit AcrB